MGKGCRERERDGIGVKLICESLTCDRRGSCASLATTCNANVIYTINISYTPLPHLKLCPPHPPLPCLTRCPLHPPLPCLTRCPLPPPLPCTTHRRYEYSLASFLTVFNQTLNTSKKDSVLEGRLRNVTEALTFDVYNYTCLGLFEKHKLMFSFQMTIKILEGVAGLWGRWRALWTSMPASISTSRCQQEQTACVSHRCP